MHEFDVSSFPLLTESISRKVLVHLRINHVHEQYPDEFPHQLKSTKFAF